ncbi:MAG: trypsin-like peptidase domain-containing protein [Candidatus Izemoplasmatales bacterium]|jgi:serine protease Do
MKKTLSLLLISLVVVFLSACEFPFISTAYTTATTQGYVTQTTTEATTSLTDVTTNLTTTLPGTTTEPGITIEYTDYQDLVDQLYQMVYNDIYQELYNDLGLAEMIDETLYEEIYGEVESRFTELIESGELLLYIDDVQQQIYEVAELTEAAVVGVTTYIGEEPQSLGSGVVYKHDALNDLYYLITNEHVVEDGDNFRVVFVDGTYVVGNLLGYDSDVDIAVLTFSGSQLERVVQVAELGDSDLARIGSFVIAAGNPKGYDFYGSVTIGILSGTNRDIGTPGVRYLQHDASINSGNSGGPLFNLDGEVIGINVSKYATTDIEGMGFAIPINLVKTVVEEIETAS